MIKGICRIKERVLPGKHSHPKLNYSIIPIEKRDSTTALLERQDAPSMPETL